MGRKRTSIDKRQREYQKRQRELKKAEKAARKRERRLNREQDGTWSGPEDAHRMPGAEDETSNRTE